jgi:hypothetical protein
VSFTVGRMFLRKSTMPLSSFFTVPDSLERWKDQRPAARSHRAPAFAKARANFNF